MEAVKAFNQELSGLYETKPPISRGKMTALTKSAIKAIKLYKHVVQSVEKFIQKCRPEYKVPGLYVIDSIVRQSRHQFSQEKDVFVPRFSKNIQTTFTHLFKCPPEDKAKIVRVLNLWQKNAVFSAEIVQPLLDLANPQKPDESPESPPPIVEEKEKKRAEPDWVKEQASAAADHRPKQKAAPSPHKKSRSHRHSQEDKTLAMVSSLLMQAQEGSSEHQQLQQLQLIQETIQKQTKVHHARPANKETLKLDEAVLNQIQSLTKQLTSLANQGTAALTEEAGPSPPPQPVKGKSPPAAVAAPAVPQEKHETGGFNSALLEFDYGDEEEDIPRKVSSPPPVAPVPAPQANPPLPPQAPPERHAVAPPQEPEDETLQASIAAVQKLTDELNHAQTQQEQMKQFMEHQDQQMMQHHHIPPPSGPPPPMMMHHQGPPPPMMPPQFFHPHHHQQYQIPLPPMNQPPPPTGHPMGALPTAMTTMVTSDQYQPEFPSEDVPTVISASPIRETGDMPVVVADSPPPQKETTHRSRSKSPRKKRGRSRSKSRSPHSSTRRKHRSKRRHRSRSRSQERSRGKRSRSRSRDRSRSRRHDRDEHEEKDENRSSDRKRGFPSLRENKASICSLTIWMGRLPKSVSEKEIRYLVEENGGGEVVSVHIVSARGCAYVLMTDRAEAAKVLDNLKYAKLHGANIKVAWAPGVGVKDKKYKDHWDVERGVSYIPWDIFSGHPGKLEELEEGSFVDIESLPEEIKKLRQPLVEEPPEMGEDREATDSEHQEPADHVPPTQSSGSPPAPANTTAPPPRFVGITPGAPVVRMSMMPGGMLPPFMGMRLNLPPGMMPPPPHGGLTPADMHSSGDAEQHPPTSIAPPLPPFGILRPGMPPLGPQVLESMPLSGSPTPHLIGQMPNRLMGLLPPRIAGLSLPVAPGRPDNKLGGPLEPPSEPKGLLGSPPGLPPGAALLLENQAKRMDAQEGMQGGMREEVDLQEKMGEMGLPPPVSLLGDLSQFAGPALRMVRPTLSQAMLPQGMMPGLVSLPRMMVPGGMMRLPGGQGIPVSLPAGLRLAPGMLAPRGLPPGMLPMVPPEIMNLLRPPIPTIETPDEQPEDQASKDVDDRVIPDYGASSPFQKEGPEGEELFNNGPPNPEAPKGDQDFRAKDSDLREPWPRPPGMMPDFRGPPPPLFRPDFPMRGPRPPWGPPFRGPPPRGMLPMGPGRPPFRGPPQHEFGPPNGPPGRWGGMDPEWRHRPPLPSLLDQDFGGGHDQDWRPRPWGIDQGMGGRPPPFPEGPPEEMDGFSGRESRRDFDQRQGNNRNWDRSRENGGRGPDHRDRSSEREERDHGDKDHRGDRDSRRGGRDRDYRAETRDVEKKEEESDLGGKDDIKRKERSQAKDKSSGDPEKRRKSRWAPVTDEAPPKPLLDIVIPAMKLKPHLAGPSPLISQEEEKPPVLGKLSPVSKPALIDDATTPVKDEKPVFEEKTVDSQGPVLVDEKPKESIGGEGLVPPPKESIGGEGLVPPPATTDDTPQPKVEEAAEPPKVEIGNNNIVKEGKTEGESVEEPAESEEKPDE